MKANAKDEKAEKREAKERETKANRGRRASYLKQPSHSRTCSAMTFQIPIPPKNAMNYPQARVILSRYDTTPEPKRNSIPIPKHAFHTLRYIRTFLDSFSTTLTKSL